MAFHAGGGLPPLRDGQRLPSADGIVLDLGEAILAAPVSAEQRPVSAPGQADLADAGGAQACLTCDLLDVEGGLGDRVLHVEEVPQGEVAKIRFAALEQLDAQLKEQQRLKSLKVEKGAVREKMDVNTISASTIEAFMRYLDLDPDANEHELQRRLTEANAHGKKTTAVRPGETPASTQGKKVDLGQGR